MTLLLAIEASQPDGTTFRVAFGWSFPPLASCIAFFARLF